MNRRLRILESNYGRNFGWYLEKEGKRIAVLTDCQWEEMFWDSYRLEPLTNKPEEPGMFYSDEFWDGYFSGGLCFRNREFDEVASDAFPAIKAGTSLKKTGRILMRALYLQVKYYPWDPFLLWLIRLLRLSKKLIAK